MTGIRRMYIGMMRLLRRSIHHVSCLSVFLVLPWSVSHAVPLVFKRIPFPNYGLNSAKPWTNRYLGQNINLLGQSQMTGTLDGMFPLLGNKNNLFFFNGVYEAASQSASLSSLGMGQRTLQPFFLKQLSRDAIYGAFIFGDVQSGWDQKNIWYINPGVEVLLNRQTARLQVYVPLGSKSVSYGTAMASQLPAGIDNAINLHENTFAVGHTLRDLNVTLAHEYGTGFDVLGEQQFNVSGGRPAKVSLGYYHYAFHHGTSLNGLYVGAEYEATPNIRVMFQNNYDDQNHNATMIGIRLIVGGPDERRFKDLHRRMEDPIERHLARGNPYAQAAPVRNVFIPGSGTIISSKAWFFSPTGTAQSGPITWANCTAERPCITIDQTISDGIASLDNAADLYFATGSYALAANGSTSGTQAVLMNNGQTMWGRTAGWISPASGGARPLINGALFWQGSGYLNSMQVTNAEQTIPGGISGFGDAAVIGVGATGQFTMNDSSISSSGTTAAVTSMGAYTSAGALSVNNSTVTASNLGGSATTYGLYANAGALSVVNTAVTAQAAGNGADAYGLNGGSRGFLLSGGSVQATASGAGSSAYGVFSESSLTQILNATIQATLNSASGTEVVGVFANASGTPSLNITGSTIVANATDVGDALGIGPSFAAPNVVTVNFSGSGSTVTSSGQAIGNEIIVNNNSSPASTCNGVACATTP